jgi:ligand-binding SRPBCC domain-containing protein
MLAHKRQPDFAGPEECPGFNFTEKTHSSKPNFSPDVISRKALTMRRIEFIQFIPGPIGKTWEFFSNPANLATITPPGMGFIITSPVPEKMYPGMFITYIVKPLAGFPMQWVTEITGIRENEFFIDEQRKGPYAIWHHEHHFKTVPGGVEMRDILHYHIPFGFLGKLADLLVVHSKVRQIFSYREAKIRELFPPKG